MCSTYTTDHLFTTMSFNNSYSTSNSNTLLKQNNRFECLNESNDDKKPQHYSRSYTKTYSNRFSNYNRDTRDRKPLDTSNRFTLGRYSFLAEKTEPKKKNQQLSISDKKFPSLIDLKAIKHRNSNKRPQPPPENNYKDVANYTEEELQEIERKKQKEISDTSYEGWISLSNDNGRTNISSMDHDGNKIPYESDNDDDDRWSTNSETYDHTEFQKKCAKAMYSNLKVIQGKRDEENMILGPHSKYYEKGSLLDLSYLSDSDIESEDENNDSSEEQECYSDYDTY